MASSRLFRYDVRHFAAMRMLAEVSLVLGIYHVGTRSRQLRAWNGRRFPIFSRSPSKRSSNPGKRKAHRSRRRPRGYAAPASLTRSGFVFFDGGHIDNLGAYELLRRRCRLFRHQRPPVANDNVAQHGAPYSGRFGNHNYRAELSTWGRNRVAHGATRPAIACLG